MVAATSTMCVNAKHILGDVLGDVHRDVFVYARSADMTTQSPCDATRRPCSNGQCLEKSRFCNGIRDCNDGSDEWNCEWSLSYDGSLPNRPHFFVQYSSMEANFDIYQPANSQVPYYAPKSHNQF